MAIIKSFSPFQNLSNFQTFLVDDNPNSDYFRISEFTEQFTGGKNGFLIEGSEFLKETTEVKIELLDVEGNPIYFEPGDGIPEYYEGVSKLVSVHVYDDTPIGLGKITILGELKNYVNENGSVVPVPQEWKGVYNVKWERTFKVNKNLANETIVRFYKRPVVSIDELVKPIFTKSVNQVTDNLSTVSGIPQLPIAGTNLSDYRAGTSYKLIRSSGSWDIDVDENTIDVDVNGTTYSSTIVEVLNGKELLVDIPYTENNIVQSFSSQSYSVTYTDFENETIGESALTGSFAKIDITQLKTFVGDVARVKVFRKSRNSSADFQFVQESRLESTELLRDITTTEDTELSYGRFDENNLSNYWVTSSNDHPLTIDSSILSQAVKVDYDDLSGGVQKLITSQSFSISKDVEYTLNFKTLFSGSIESGDYLKAYFSGSYPSGNSFTQSFVDITPDGSYNVRKTINENLLAEINTDAQLVFEFKGDDWYVSNVSLKNAQDTSFSPDEFTLIQDIPRKIAVETFDFRFEFYDINNNYIPVNVVASKEFNGGNDFPTSGKLLTFESDRNAFRYSSGSIRNPENQQIQFKTTAQNLTGSILFTSQAFDTGGLELVDSEWIQYPGLLSQVTPAGALITIDNFEGIYDTASYGETPYVGSIIYTASLEGLEEFETIYRLEDGDNAPQLIVTSNANQFIYEPTTLSPKPSGQSIKVRAQRKNLASLVTPIEVNSGSGAPPLTFVQTLNGIDTYTISALEYSASFADSVFPETTYSFTGSDVFGNQQSDEITISPVINFDGVSVVLSNESTTLTANSVGFVSSSDFELTSGSATVYVAGNLIPFDDNGGKNTFEITNLQGTNCDPNGGNGSDPTTNEYGITAISADKAALDVTVTYTAGDGFTSQSFQKNVSYTRAKSSPPTLVVEIDNPSQTVPASSINVQSGSFENVTFRVIETYNGVEYIFEGPNDGRISNGITYPFGGFNAGVSPMIGGWLTNRVGNPDYTIPPESSSAVGHFGFDYEDLEGSTRRLGGSYSLSKVKKPSPTTTITLSPQTQTVTSSSLGVGSPIPVEIIASETGFKYSYGGGSLSDGVFNIDSVTGGTNNLDGTFTPDEPGPNGLTGSVNIFYQNSDSAVVTNQVLYFDVSVAAAGTSGESGSTGPGIVFRGPWDSGTSYQFDESNGRRDSVLYDDIYYVALQPSLNQAPTGLETDNEYWQSLGTQDFFVAAKIAIFEDSYIQNTLNVGTNNGGLGDSANITINGGSTNPYISINQSGTYGSQGYDVDGIFMGMDGGTEKLSLKNGAGNYLRWTGTALEISGDLNFGNGDTISQDGTFSLGGGDLTYNGTTLSVAVDLDLNSTNPVDGDFSDGGIFLSTDGWISAEEFYIGSDGSAAFGGNLEAAGGTFSGTVEVGSTIKIGENVNSTYDGIYIDSNNYWYDSSGPTTRMRVGASSSALFYDTTQGVVLVAGSGASGIRVIAAGGSPKYYLASDGIQLTPTIGGTPGGKINFQGGGSLYYNQSTSATILDASNVLEITGDLDVSGAITADGNITAYASSDKRLKDNITPLTSPLIKISKIGGYEFDWNGNQSDFEGHDVGVIAQEIKEVVPEVVIERKDGYLAVRYEKLVPLLIEGIKELTDRVEKLEEENKKLKEK